MSKTPKTKIQPPPQPKGPPQESVEMLLIKVSESQRIVAQQMVTIGELCTRLYNEVLARQTYINNLPVQKAKAGEVAGDPAP